MWITYFNWFMAIFSIVIWISTYIVWEKAKFTAWFDNKFGRDDPMPPMPKQLNNSVSIGEKPNFNYQKPSDSDQQKE